MQHATEADDILSRHFADDYLVLIYKAKCLAKKKQIPICNMSQYKKCLTFICNQNEKVMELKIVTGKNGIKLHVCSYHTFLVVKGLLDLT